MLDSTERSRPAELDGRINVIDPKLNAGEVLCVVAVVTRVGHAGQEISAAVQGVWWRRRSEVRAATDGSGGRAWPENVMCLSCVRACVRCACVYVCGCGCAVKVVY